MKHTGRATSKLGRLLVTEEGVVVLESQQWRTPRPLAVAVARHMGITVYPGAPPFDLDAAADDSCSLGTFHFSAERSCLLHDWVSWLSWASSDIRNAWHNPPFGQEGVPRKKLRDAGLNPDDFAPFPGIAAHIARAEQQCRAHGIDVAVCIPSPADENRWKQLRGADEWLWCGRVPFVDLDGKPRRDTPGAHTVAIFRPHVPVGGWPGGPRHTEFFDWRKRGHEAT